jgi:hypothetical protein
MERGDASDARLMEPVRALLALYADPARSAKITADAEALRKAQAAALAKAHPVPPEPSVIRFYTSQDDEIPALEQAAKARRNTAAAAEDAFPDISGSSIPAETSSK